MDRRSTINVLRRTRSFYGDFPPPNEVADQLDIPKEEADSLWQEFLDSEDKRLSASKMAPKPKRKYVRKAKPVEEPPKKEEEKKHLHDLPLEAIKVLAGISAVVIAIRMVGYLMEYFTLWETSEVLAWTTAIALAMALFVSLQVAVTAWRGKQFLLFVVSALLFGVVAFIDMSGTASIIAKKKQAIVAVERSASEDVLRARDQIPKLESDMKAAQTQIDTLNKERLQLIAEQSKLNEASETYKKDYVNMRGRLATNKTSIDETQKKFDTDKASRDAFANTPGLYSTAVADGTDGVATFLDWCVAVGLGLVGPWALSVTLFLRGKDEEAEKNKAD